MVITRSVTPIADILNDISMNNIVLPLQDHINILGIDIDHELAFNSYNKSQIHM